MTALYDRSQYTEFVVERLAKGPTVIEVNRKRVVAEYGERFVMMTVHVTHKEVENGQVHNVQHPTTTIIRRKISDDFTVIWI